MPIAFSEFLYIEQRGRCYLGITEECRTFDRYLHPDQLGKGAKHARGWTWEHVIPRKTQAALCDIEPPIRGASLRLLSCQRCNEAKGNTLPSADTVRVAVEITRGYPLHAERSEELARRFLARDRKPKRDLPVPATVEEALAQGGIKA